MFDDAHGRIGLYTPMVPFRLIEQSDGYTLEELRTAISEDVRSTLLDRASSAASLGACGWRDASAAARGNVAEARRIVHGQTSEERLDVGMSL